VPWRPIPTAAPPVATPRMWAHSSTSAACNAPGEHDAVDRRGQRLRRERTSAGASSCCRCRCCEGQALRVSATVNADLIMRAPIALVPVLLFLGALVHGDAYKLLRLKVVLALVAAGALAAGASYLLNNWAYAHFPGDFEAYSRYVSPWIEESLKAVLIVFLIRTRRVGLPVDAGIAGLRSAPVSRWSRTCTTWPRGRRPRCRCKSSGASARRSCMGGTATVLAMISITLYESRPNGGLQLLLPGLPGGGGATQRLQRPARRPALATLATLLAPAVGDLPGVFGTASARYATGSTRISTPTCSCWSRSIPVRSSTPTRPLPAVAARPLPRRRPGGHAVLSATARGARAARQGHTAAAPRPA